MFLAFGEQERLGIQLKKLQKIQKIIQIKYYSNSENDKDVEVD